MTAPDLWPEIDLAGTLAELGSVFDSLGEISVLFVAPNIPAERVVEWIAAHRKPARLEIRVLHDDQ